MNKRLPPGVDFGTVEIFSLEGELFAMFAGNKFLYSELPLMLRTPFIVEYAKDKLAAKALKAMGVPAELREKKFVSCRYGNYDSIPDLDAEGNLQADAVICNKYHKCPGYGIVCKNPLSRKELRIVREIATGALDKEIAQRCNVELSTLRTHESRIRKKLNLNTRCEIALWAFTHNIHEFTTK